MSYTKHTWKNGETISDTLLNNMENGIEGASIETVNVSVDANTGTPSGTATYSAGTLNLNFKNLKGDKGDTGAKGEKGDKGDTGAGLTGEAQTLEALTGSEEIEAVRTKVNEIITQLKARGVSI